MEFKSFDKIEHISKLRMIITQKLNGTNSHILIQKIEGEPVVDLDKLVKVNDSYYQVQAASRNRFIYPYDDNYGFAQFVEENKIEIVEKLGEGRHDGEWAGLGINSGEGLPEKRFILFAFWRYPPARPLPPRMMVVPVLYNGKFSSTAIDDAMADLKENGSKLVEGFMRPEGIVVTIAGKRFKHVFEAEETQWTKGKNKGKNPKVVVDFSHLCQPIRLEKLISKDERYTRDYPRSLPGIVKDYIADLIDEGQITGDADQIKSIRNGATSQIFKFIKTVMEEI